MTDETIMAERAALYGDAGKMYMTSERMTNHLRRFCNGDTPMEDADKWYATLGMMSKVISKIVRIGANPRHLDSYADARNYLTLIERLWADNTGNKATGTPHDKQP